MLIEGKTHAPTITENQKMPAYDATFQRLAIADDLDYKNDKEFGLEFPLAVGLMVHRHDNGVIVINYPGYGSKTDGYESKYEKLGEYVRQKIGAVLRTDNPHYSGFYYPKSVQDHLKAVIEYAIKNSKKISGQEDPIIYLMGYSAGASGIAAVAHEYPQVKKILLMAPSGDAGMETVRNGLNKFEGECYIAVGENDQIVGQKAGEIFSSMATSASLVKKVIIPNCDHQFRGEENGRIMSASPLWAFLGKDEEKPNPKDGIKLYD